MDSAKNIVITYPDAEMMHNFCKEDGALSKSFFDWYLIEEKSFFAETGVLIISDLMADDDKAVIEFDFRNPEVVPFKVYSYNSKEKVTEYTFVREENLKLDTLKIHINYVNSKYFSDIKTVFTSQTARTALHNVMVKHKYIRKLARKKTRDNHSQMAVALRKKIDAEKHAIRSAFMKTNEVNCQSFTTIIYALMYYVAKRAPEEITTVFNAQLNAEEKAMKVKGIYEYTGYVDLRKNKTYKPIIPRDPDLPVRTYERHIEKWTVRGHYRRTKNGLTWVGEHTKGTGTLENRTYATVDESELSLTPKVFEVERTVKPGTHSGQVGSIPEPTYDLSKIIAPDANNPTFPVHTGSRVFVGTGGDIGNESIKQFVEAQNRGTFIDRLYRFFGIKRRK